MPSDLMISEFLRVYRLIDGLGLPPCEREKALSALRGIRGLAETEQIDEEAAHAMASKLATATRLAARTPHRNLI